VLFVAGSAVSNCQISVDACVSNSQTQIEWVSIMAMVVIELYIYVYISCWTNFFITSL